jgi:hypothetical protein
MITATEKEKGPARSPTRGPFSILEGMEYRLDEKLIAEFTPRSEANGQACAHPLLSARQQ